MKGSQVQESCRLLRASREGGTGSVPSASQLSNSEGSGPLPPNSTSQDTLSDKRHPSHSALVSFSSLQIGPEGQPHSWGHLRFT